MVKMMSGKKAGEEDPPDKERTAAADGGDGPSFMEVKKGWMSWIWNDCLDG
jgi:hypothetical protein